jgi:hypothetical protein
MNEETEKYIDNNIACSIMGTEMIISLLEKYTSFIFKDTSIIREECLKAKENRNIIDNIVLPSIRICDTSTDMMFHKMEMLKSSLDRFLFSEEDLYYKLRTTRYKMRNKVKNRKRILNNMKHFRDIPQPSSLNLQTNSPEVHIDCES